MTRQQSHLRLIRGADGLARVVPEAVAAKDSAVNPERRNGASSSNAREVLAGEKGSQQRRHAREQDLLMPSEVAALFRVSPKTVARWTKTGKLAATRTQGGHHRFNRNDVLKLLRESGLDF